VEGAEEEEEEEEEEAAVDKPPPESVFGIAMCCLDAAYKGQSAEGPPSALVSVSPVRYEAAGLHGRAVGGVGALYEAYGVCSVGPRRRPD